MQNQDPEYYVYITTNSMKSAFYTGVTNNLKARLLEHYRNRGNTSSFAGRYYAYLLIYYEIHPYIQNAIQREKQIKGWSREKKLDMVRKLNPELKSLNARIFGKWPPDRMMPSPRE